MSLKLAGGVLLALAVLLLAGFGLWFGAALETRHWPTAQGRVLTSETRYVTETRENTDTGKKERVESPVTKIVYEYTVTITLPTRTAPEAAHRTLRFTSDRVYLSGRVADPAYITRHPVGTAVTVYYDPEDPGRGILEIESPWAMTLLLPGLLVGAAGVVCVLASRNA